jgi:hypothetical protein
VFQDADFYAAYHRLSTVGDAQLVIGQTLLEINRLEGTLSHLSRFSSIDSKAFTLTALEGKRKILEQIYKTKLPGGGANRLQDAMKKFIPPAVLEVAKIGGEIGDAASEGFVARVARNAGAAVGAVADGVKTTGSYAIKGAEKVIETAGEVTGSVAWAAVKGLWAVLLVLGIGLYVITNSKAGAAAGGAAA